jgi:hypothetical protein
MMSVLIILLGVTAVLGCLCLVHLWKQQCSVLRRILWIPVPFIPLLGPLIYYALFKVPPVKPESEQATDTFHLYG